MRKKLSGAIALCLLLSAFPFSGCNSQISLPGSDKNVLRVAIWDEYIDMGGDVYQGDDEDLVAFRTWYQDTFGIDLLKSKSLYEEFEDWYKKEYPDKPPITVADVALQDNETMYNKIKMGDEYDILCPSEYMAIKLKNEGYLKAFDKDFLENTSNPKNYYARTLSPFIADNLKTVELDEYLAGYMWGTTGFVFNPEKISPKTMKSWNCLTSAECARSITAKDNTRDSYFMGLGMYYEEQLRNLPKDENYAAELARMMNDTSNETINGVKKCLEKARKNLYGLETDEAKTDMIMGWLNASYQWSGDAVFILNEAEYKDEPLELHYSIPEAASNLWFDGWVMMKNAKQDVAEAFINFLSMPQNVVRNMYYIGYTSCAAGYFEEYTDDDSGEKEKSNPIFEYVRFTYEDMEAEKTSEYDLRYFFGENTPLLIVDELQLTRQLFAQYPSVEAKDRLVVMQPFDKESNERVNRMWINIK